MNQAAPPHDAVDATEVRAWSAPRAYFLGPGALHSGSEALLEVALRAGQMGTWWWDRETGAGAWCEAQSRLLGFEAGSVEVSYATMLALVVPDDRARFEAACVEVFEHGEVELEFRIRRNDGKERWLLGRGRSVDGRVAVGINVDVTERKQAEQRARARDETLALALAAGGMGTWEADLEGADVRWSDGLYAMFGIARDAAPMTRARILEMVLPEDRDLYAAAVERLHGHGEADVEMRVRRPDGQVRWIYGHGRLSKADEQIALGVAHDITARKEAEIALRESETRLQLALAAGRMGVWEWDMRRDVSHWSEGMFTLLGLASGTPPSAAQFFSMVLDEDRAGLEAAVQTAIATGNYAHEFRLRRGDGTVVWLVGQGATVRDAEGRPTRLMGASFDITERKQAEAAREEASRRKDDFLAMLAHELRNPLAAIGAAADVLPQTSADARATAAAGIVARQVRHLARLVDDLVDVARITRGRIELRRVPTDIAPVLAQATEQVQPIIGAHGQSLALSAPDESVLVLADATRLVQVFVNLLTNAAKYSDVGARIDVQVVPEAAWVKIVVEDSGAGIDAAMLPHVFEPFTQGPRTLDRTEGGLGLGLAVVKALVEMHGGTVRAHSDGHGLGSRFTIRLPRAAAADAPAPSTAAPATAQALRILVVDDNADAAESLAMLLELEGHVVRTAMDGASALAVAARFAPHVALLDIGLPGMDGYALAAALRADPAHRALRLVALTGYGQPEDRERSLAAGFDTHLVKPVAPEELAHCLRAAASPA